MNLPTGLRNLLLCQQPGAVPLSKPIVQPSVPLVLHKPSEKTGGTTAVAEHPATPKSGVEFTATVEPVPKTESTVLEQPKQREKLWW